VLARVSLVRIVRLRRVPGVALARRVRSLRVLPLRRVLVRLVRRLRMLVLLRLAAML
jgi:hypothetical protein